MKYKLFCIIIIFLSSLSILKSESYPGCTILQKVLSIQTADSLNWYKTEFNNINRESDFKLWFDKMKIFKESLSNEIHENLNLFSSSSLNDSVFKCFNSAHSYLYAIWIEEGTRFYLTFNNKVLYEKALETRGKNDEHFFKSVLSSYGDVGEYFKTFPSWMIPKSDITGSMRLGDYTIYKLYSRLLKNSSSNKLFNKGSYEILDHLRTDILASKRFENKKDSVVSELHSLLKIDPSIRKSVQDLIEKFNSHPSFFQFDCKTLDCTYE